MGDSAVEQAAMTADQSELGGKPPDSNNPFAKFGSHVESVETTADQGTVVGPSAQQAEGGEGVKDIGYTFEDLERILGGETSEESARYLGDALSQAEEGVVYNSKLKLRAEVDRQAYEKAYEDYGRDNRQEGAAVKNDPRYEGIRLQVENGLVGEEIERELPKHRTTVVGEVMAAELRQLGMKLEEVALRGEEGVEAGKRKEALGGLSDAERKALELVVGEGVFGRVEAVGRAAVASGIPLGILGELMSGKVPAEEVVGQIEERGWSDLGRALNQLFMAGGGEISLRNLVAGGTPLKVKVEVSSGGLKVVQVEDDWSQRINSQEQQRGSNTGLEYAVMAIKPKAVEPPVAG